MPNKNGMERVRQARRSVKGMRLAVGALTRALSGTRTVARRRLITLGERLHVFEDAVAETYGWGRKAMAAAYRSGEGAAFDDWRRAVKYHAHHVRLLTELWPDELEGRLEVLARLAGLLAEDHELALHADSLRREAGAEAGVRPELLELVDQRRQALHALARPLGKRLFSERPAALARRHRAYWKALVAERTERPAPLREAWRRLAPATLATG